MMTFLQAGRAATSWAPGKREQVIGAEFDEALCADGTICMPQDTKSTHQLLRGIEIEGLEYHMKLRYTSTG